MIIILVSYITVVGILFGIGYKIYRSQVHLKVVPKIFFKIEGGCVFEVDRVTDRVCRFIRQGFFYQLCFEVTNLSAFAITVSRAGIGDANGANAVFLPVKATSTVHGDIWPIRLESKEDVVLYGKDSMNYQGLYERGVKDPTKVFVETSCKVVQYGTSSIFKKYIKGQL